MIAPIADQLNNSGNVGINYQFAVNGMVGASGTFSNLHYPNQAEVPGLFDSSSQGASVFYSLRVSKMHYIGATYQYQRLVSYPTLGAERDTDSCGVPLLHALRHRRVVRSPFSEGRNIRIQCSHRLVPLTIQLPEARAWTPAAGGSMSWQGRLTNVAISYSHIISGGGGLIGAVKMDSATASIRQQITRRLERFDSRHVRAERCSRFRTRRATNGHTVSGTASLQQEFGQHINVQLGYTRLHQDYSGVAVLAATPNTNREFVSISYQFSRPLGR